MPIASQLVPAADDIPRRPHDTVLYRIVREALATFLAHTERTYAAPLPEYVIDTFEHAPSLENLKTRDIIGDSR